MQAQILPFPKTLVQVLPTLAQDDRGLEVAALQGILAFYRYLPANAVNGIFEAVTDDAVRQFQHDNALFEDGIVGPHTWRALVDLN